MMVGYGGINLNLGIWYKLLDVFENAIGIFFTYKISTNRAYGKEVKVCGVAFMGPPSPPSLYGKRKTSLAFRGLCYTLLWPAKACNPGLACCSGGSRGELRSDRKNVSCAVHELREYYLIVGLMENIIWGWCRSFQRSASNLRSGALLKTAGRGWRPAFRALHAPELSRSANRAQLGLCQGSWQLWLGMCGGSAQLQALAPNPRASGQGLESTSPCAHAGHLTERRLWEYRAVWYLMDLLVCPVKSS